MNLPDPPKGFGAWIEHTEGKMPAGVESGDLTAIVTHDEARGDVTYSEWTCPASDYDWEPLAYNDIAYFSLEADHPLYGDRQPTEAKPKPSLDELMDNPLFGMWG